MRTRLSKVLTAAGIDSRRTCEKIIKNGHVTVNGKVVHLPQTEVNWERDRITVNGKRIRREQQTVYFLLNKPAGYLCTTIRKERGARVVLDLFPPLPYRLFTVGRLDQATTGLLLVTNDGQFANSVIHPSYQISKEYLAKTSQEITADHLKILMEGALVQGVRVKPLSVKKVRRGTLKITVGEGKKHEVRILLQNAGLTTKELCRIRIGPFTLGTLPLGAYRELTPKEVKTFIY